MKRPPRVLRNMLKTAVTEASNLPKSPSGLHRAADEPLWEPIGEPIRSVTLSRSSPVYWGDSMSGWGGGKAGNVTLLPGSNDRFIFGAGAGDGVYPHFGGLDKFTYGLSKAGPDAPLGWTGRGSPKFIPDSPAARRVSSPDYKATNIPGRTGNFITNNTTAKTDTVFGSMLDPGEVYTANAAGNVVGWHSPTKSLGPSNRFGAPNYARPINTTKTGAGHGVFGGTAGFATSIGVGAFGGYLGADEDNKAFGALGGALAGFGAGGALANFAKNRAGWTSKQVVKFAQGGSSMRQRGFTTSASAMDIFTPHLASAQRNFHSAEYRNTVFRSGAMLGGMAFGTLFASNGRSHKRGFNSSRGNSFSR